MTVATVGRRFRRGGAGSGTMHQDLRNMIRSSNSYDEFLQKLNDWADAELVPSHREHSPTANRSTPLHSPHHLERTRGPARASYRRASNE